MRSMHARRALRRRTGDHKRHARICGGTGICARLLRIPPPSRDLPLRPAQVRAREAQDRDPPSHQVYLAKRAAPRVFQAPAIAGRRRLRNLSSLLALTCADRWHIALSVSKLHKNSSFETEKELMMAWVDRNRTWSGFGRSRVPGTSR